MSNTILIYDRQPLKTSKVKTLGDGSLMLPARFSRAGIQVYGAPRFDVPTNVMRHAKDWLAPTAVAQLAGLTLTVDHVHMVDEDNVSAVSVGMVGTDVGVEDGHTVGTIIVQGKATKDLILSRAKVDLSVGYSASIVPESGVHDGVPYEWAMYPVSMNHVAIVESGRAGSARIMLDSAQDGLHCLAQQSVQTVQRGDTMSEQTIDVNDAGKGWTEVVIDGESVKVRRDASALLVRVAKERNMAIADAAEKTGKIAGLEAKIAELKAATPNDAEIRDAVANELKGRWALEADCKAIGVEVADSVSDADLRRAAIAKLSPDFKIDKMADAEIGGLYNYLIGESKAAKAGDAQLRDAIDGIGKGDVSGPELTPGQLAMRSALHITTDDK